MLEILLVALYGIIGAIAALNEKEKATIETHMKAGIVLGLVTLFLGILVLLEYLSFSSVPGYTIQLPSTLIPVQPGMEFVYPIFAFITSFINYIVAAIVSKIYFYFKESIKL